jgi:lysozyme
MNIDKLAAQLERHEGLRLKPYKDTVGKLTIGIGRNLDDRGITVSEARFLLYSDIDRVIGDLTTHLSWWLELSENRKLVLADMCFNLGIAGLLKFKRTLKAVREGRYEEASVYMLESLWADQVGKRARVLAEMMRKG